MSIRLFYIIFQAIPLLTKSSICVLTYKIPTMLLFRTSIIILIVSRINILWLHQLLQNTILTTKPYLQRCQNIEVLDYPHHLPQLMYAFTLSYSREYAKIARPLLDIYKRALCTISSWIKPQ